MLSVSTTTIAVVLAFHPFSVPSGGFAHRSLAPAPVAEPDDQAQPGWDDSPADTPVTDEVPPPEVTATEVPPPSSIPTVAPVDTPKPGKPTYRKGTGLIIGASITGGLGWVVALTRFAFTKQCQRAIEDASDEQSGVSAGWTCFVRAGAANVALAPVQWTLGAATWGLAAGAGAVRGRYDGVEDAWSGKPARKSGGFIGAGAAMLALGVIGRITAAATVGRPYRHLTTTEIDGKAFAAEYRARLIGVQLSSAVIGLGAGLLAYGVAYRQNHTEQQRAVQQVRVAPSFDLDPHNGIGSVGLSMTGHF